MARIAMIGAGSIVFCKTLMMDIMATEGLEGSTFALMNRTKPKLDQMEKFANRVVKENKLPAKIEAALDRREAFKGADYVINMIQVGGVDAFGMDYEIPMKYGVDQCIGDTMGPGGIFRTLRTVPVVNSIARDMEELCPNAFLLNYTNPMAMVCWGLGEATKVRFVGLCHGVQTTLDLIARYCGVNDKKDIDYLCAGINHMDWFLKLEKDGKDLYPILKKNIEKPEYYINEKVRCEVMRHLGYFMTESTGHLSEYLPWFRKNKKALDLYCDQPSFGGETGAYYKWCKRIAEKFKEIDYLEEESPKLKKRSSEYCSYIIEAMETNKVFKFMGNVRNENLITNLPNGSCVEVPVFADRSGFYATRVGDLPPQCAAANMLNIIPQGLAVKAALTGDFELAIAAVQTDPLTSAVLTMKEARDMAVEMYKAEKQYLPQFDEKDVRRVSEIKIPKGTKGVDVPLDPALAIVHRFGELAK
ncbi:alpha-glucosidase/alpha-galactosidase [Candidatus Desantisbacteria bacterium CG_4_10_14_0_8_um_filter_48_22]|uniref:Alpha-glucosidase/alpha-galactosidase n=1 Tax=Candidatus Desantisbacteria bacterium CG_4_10_14_0_8_um_filter_48_22 TaxID=1974543 RepID=A0A2M7S874_9BACT|nr:MAG: alpha-glucosidase/alpha-galactosidase [Candidatus Desantisbacteria bacterium CG_4_10_14_0_8_um_filter_48_22]